MVNEQDPPVSPAIPPKVRTFTYFLILIWSVLSVLITGLSAIFLDMDTATKVAAAAGVVGAAIGVWAGGVGVVYRPTKGV